MVSNTLAGLLAVLQSHGYLIIFVLMFIEGPIVAFAAAFAAALGYFNVWILLVLFILGNQIPDVLVFKLGGVIRGKTVEKFVSYFGLHKKRIAWLEKNMKKHFIKTLITYKTVPPLPTPGILLSGFMRVPFKRFFWIDLAYNVFYAVVFVSLGYYSGLAANMSLKYFKLGQYLLIVAVVLVMLFYLLIRWVFSMTSRGFKD